jgi:hypothetical protein
MARAFKVVAPRQRPATVSEDRGARGVSIGAALVPVPDMTGAAPPRLVSWRPMTAGEFEAWVVQLAGEFKRRGMDTHVRLLRDYWRVWHVPPDQGAWTAADVVCWMEQFGLLPGQPLADGAA